MAKNKMMSIPWGKLENCNLDEAGYLNVNVFRYVLKIPISDAFVRISKLTISGLYRESGMGVYIDTNKSDENGKVPTFKLPVLKDDNSIYILSVQSPEYHSAYVIDVPIYHNITTTYDIYLRHYTYGGVPDYEFILQPQMPGHESRSRLIK